MSVQAFLDDCEVTGKKFASPRLRLTVTHSRALVTRLMFLAHVGFCGKNNIPPQYEVKFSCSRKYNSFCLSSKLDHFRILWMNLVFLPETLRSLEELLAVKLLEFGPNISLIEQINNILAFINMIFYARVHFLVFQKYGRISL